MELSHPAFRTYREALNARLATEQAGERSHYAALEGLLEALCPGLVPVCEPLGEEAGIPDYKLTLGGNPVGYVECKDLGVSLDRIERTDQFKRYSRYPSLLITDFLEFRWYLDGQLHDQARLGEVGQDRKVHLTVDGESKVETLLRRFLEFRVEFPATAQALAGRLARFAQELCEEAKGSFAGVEKPLESLRVAFEKSLLPNLSVDDFADMYAQTLTYGLFSARFELPTGAVFARNTAFEHLPPTNPFLRDLFYHIMGPGMPERVRWVVEEIVETLARTDISEIAKDFARRSGREDPVVHFYETFLREYDPRRREVRGVYYTPEPVVSYIVRSIDWLLKEKFDKPLGLADPDVYILDPACGTGTFLFEAIKIIRETICPDGTNRAAWTPYVREHLLPRLFGFELLMAPYTIAHMKLAIQLRETGYDFAGEERLGIYLTNTLEEARDRTQQVLGYPELEEETHEADAVKQHEKIMVVMGNPPYSVSSANKGPWIEGLMETYKAAVRGERNIQPLSDDYIKFIRFAQERIEQTGYGIVGMITNDAWLSGLIHRGMRAALLRAFAEILLLDLHGSSRVSESAPEGMADENVFDIIQGVGISLMVRPVNWSGTGSARRADLWGTRQEKYQWLGAADASRTEWAAVPAADPHYYFFLRDTALEPEYNHGIPVTQLFEVNSSGIKTHRDHFVVAYDAELLVGRISALRRVEIPDAEIAEQYNLPDTGTWSLSAARESLREDDRWQDSVVQCLYRPFDRRWLCYHDALIERPRREVMRHLLRPNLGLLCLRRRRTAETGMFFVTRDPAGKDAVSLTDMDYIFPLYVYPSEETLEAGEGRRPNLNPEFIAEMERRLGLRFVPEGEGDLGRTGVSPVREGGVSGETPDVPGSEEGSGGRADLPSGGTPDVPGSGEGSGETPDVPGLLRPVGGELEKTRRHLPHWQQGGSTYFITFRLHHGELAEPERQMVLESCLYWHGKKWHVYAAVVMPNHVHILAQPLPLGATGVSPVKASGRTGVSPVKEGEGSGGTPELLPSGETPDLPGGYYPLSQILHSIKSYTAHEINSRRGTSGMVWVAESFDRIVRDQEEFGEKLRYTLNNAVKAGIVKDGWAYSFFWVEAMGATGVPPVGKDGRTGVSPVREGGVSGETPDVPGSEEGSGGRADLPGTFGPEDVFYYAYAVFHSPTYRERYAEFLKIDFPRLPLTSDRELFAALVAKGKRLVELHLMREEGEIAPRPRFEGEGENVVERVRYVEEMTGETPVLPGRVYINPKQYFEGVEPEVWEFHIGGYQVCEKWLKDRKGRTLSYEDIQHYQQIVLALRETRQIMREIDEIIPGWPLELQTGPAS